MEAQTSLFAPAVGAAPPRPQSDKDRILDAHESKHRAYLDRLRAALRAEAELRNDPLTTDDAWRLMVSHEDLKMPAGMSPMALGPLFRGDKDEQGRPRWEFVRMVESRRAGAHSNLLRSWRLID